VHNSVQTMPALLKAQPSSYIIMFLDHEIVGVLFLSFRDPNHTFVSEIRTQNLVSSSVINNLGVSRCVLRESQRTRSDQENERSHHRSTGSSRHLLSTLYPCCVCAYTMHIVRSHLSAPESHKNTRPRFLVSMSVR